MTNKCGQCGCPPIAPDSNVLEDEVGVFVIEFFSNYLESLLLPITASEMPVAVAPWIS